MFVAVVFSGVELHQSKENVEIVPQETCIEHKGPETMRQEQQAVKHRALTGADVQKINDSKHMPYCDRKRFLVM
ncbi:hypothetical protein DICVIV_10438 [Dictyocaulus viviparus]|uniref:Uncharacterized protein n=1 Tax=Dictyocaulus viviparus TaxID=29172 RepID=A0A0D8XMD5_DICVI|nr:hypothetical protein DICVIV_10438 [Dictyocaulus viviparus]